MVKRYVYKNQTKIDLEITSVEVWNEEENGCPCPVAPGHTLIEYRAVGKLIIAKFSKVDNPFTRDVSTVTLQLCRGSGGGKKEFTRKKNSKTGVALTPDQQPLMILRFGMQSIEIYAAGKRNTGAHVSVVTPERKDQIIRLSTLDVLHENFDLEALVNGWSNQAPSRSFADILVDQTINPGLGNVTRMEALYAFKLYPGITIAIINKLTLRKIAQWIHDFALRWYAQKSESHKVELGAKLYWLDSKGQGFDKRDMDTTLYNQSNNTILRCPKCQTGIKRFHNSFAYCPMCQRDTKQKVLTSFFQSSPSSSSSSSSSNNKKRKTTRSNVNDTTTPNAKKKSKASSPTEAEVTIALFTGEGKGSATDPIVL